MTDRDEKRNRQEITITVKPSIVDEGNYIAAPVCPSRGPAFGRGVTRIDAIEDCVRTIGEHYDEEWW